MRLVAVNHLHPQAAEVGGMRFARFSEALAARGHHVVLLTQPLAQAEPAPDLGRVAHDMERHDWSRPFHLACPPRPAPILAWVRDEGVPRPLRRAVLAWHYLRHGGVFTDWRDGTRPLWPLLAGSFRPDLAWGAFGNTDALAIAQGIARLAGCPWVMDMKDVWDAFVPKPVQGLALRRFRDAALSTGLSLAHLKAPARLAGVAGTVVYSGVPSRLLLPAAPEMPFRVMITGSTYGWLDAMVEGIGRFLEQLAPEERSAIVFTYAGAEHEAAARAAQRLKGAGIDIRPFVPLDELAGLHRQAFLNLYGRATGHRDFFHHKLFELLCADRPVACFPGEEAEAVEIAARLRGQLHRCSDTQSLVRVLGETWRDRRAQGIGIDRQAMAGFTWEGQAERLEAAFDQARNAR